MLEGGVRVQSPILPQSELKFNYSQFFRSFLYEALSFPTLQWIAVLVVETLVFGHTVEEAMYCAGARFFAPIPIIGERMRKAFRQIDKSANICSCWDRSSLSSPRLRCLLISEKLESILSRWSCCHFF